MLSRYAVKVVPRDLNTILVHLYCEQNFYFSKCREISLMCSGTSLIRTPLELGQVREMFHCLNQTFSSWTTTVVGKVASVSGDKILSVLTLAIEIPGWLQNLPKRIIKLLFCQLLSLCKNSILEHWGWWHGPQGRNKVRKLLSLCKKTLRMMTWPSRKEEGEKPVLLYTDWKPIIQQCTTTMVVGYKTRMGYGERHVSGTNHFPSASLFHVAQTGWPALPLELAHS